MVPILRGFSGIYKQYISFFTEVSWTDYCACYLLRKLDVLTSAGFSDCTPSNWKSQMTLQMGKVWAVAYQECRDKSTL